MNPVIQSLFNRKSVRAYTGETIPEADVRLILETAAQAPIAGNQQLYTILRITDPEKKKALSISCDHQPFIEKANASTTRIFRGKCSGPYECIWKILNKTRG